VFEETAKAGAERLCYASSVAAYGFHEDNPDWLTEDVPRRGTPEHFYSAQKAEVEEVLMRCSRTDQDAGDVFRPLHRGGAAGADAARRDPLRSPVRRDA
jgi:nucleoside-diphosphate-sugar epimerase